MFLFCYISIPALIFLDFSVFFPFPAPSRYQFGAFIEPTSMPPKSIKDLEETLQTILDKLAHLQTKIQQTHDHHETRYNSLHHTIESRQKDWDSKQEVVNHTLHIILTS